MYKKMTHDARENYRKMQAELAEGAEHDEEEGDVEMDE